VNKLFKQRFNESEAQILEVESSKTVDNRVTYIDDDLLLNWTVKVRHLLSTVCGEQSQHFQQFEKNENEDTAFTTNYDTFKSLQAVFLAAKEDFEGGYLSSIKTLVQAEVFDTELEQASELLRSGYYHAAAIITGVVLETALRELCNKKSIANGKLDRMNADLAKAGVYNKLVQKRITALAAIRNSAAHGKSDEFTNQDVTNMIIEVEQLLANYFVD
jgi:hypothetical protein